MLDEAGLLAFVDTRRAGKLLSSRKTDCEVSWPWEWISCCYVRVSCKANSSEWRTRAALHEFLDGAD